MKRNGKNKLSVPRTNPDTCIYIPFLHSSLHTVVFIYSSGRLQSVVVVSTCCRIAFFNFEIYLLSIYTGFGTEFVEYILWEVELTF